MQPVTPSGSLEIDSGFATAQGRRQANEDFGGVWPGTASERVRHGVVAAVADGVGGNKGGRVAAETVVRAFIDGYGGLAASADVHTAAARSLDAINAWISAQGQKDPYLASMATTFTALILRSQEAHIVHVGDSRAYVLRDGQLRRLTSDHVLQHPDFTHVLTRALGEAETVRIDYGKEACCVGDRFLLCTDGVYGVLDDARIDAVLRQHTAQAAAQALVDASLEAGSGDNVTAIIVDVVALPMASYDEIRARLADLPIGEMPKRGDVIDGFELLETISKGQHSHLFKAIDRLSGQEVVMKFPRLLVAQTPFVRDAFFREIYVASRVSTGYTAEAVTLAPERQTRLYNVMPYYDGENLEQRLQRSPRVSLIEGIAVAVRLGKALAALHRKGILHRDVKPENTILQQAGGLKLIDFGAALIPEVPDVHQGEQPGTASFMAPEMFTGAPATVRTDIYALGVTIYRMFTRGYPYGEVEAFSRPRFGSPTSLRQARPSLPVWLDRVIARTISVDPAERFADTIELVFELERGMASREATRAENRIPIYARNPVAFWKVVSLLLAVGLCVALARLYK
ncbi:MAG: bifunctional protein-serine/threonine kinase/phosphatase [Rhodospirillaceae bacterium]|nr:MAG: bifunctional protein-serine/threonine kinase/phosphatase [Rhodospirillaceae bacterium]